MLIIYMSSDVSNDTMEENTVRLIKSIGNNTGFVELYSLGHWIPICGYFWDILDASVACRELGYLTAVSTTRKIHDNYRYFRGYTYTYSCTGDESTLKQCSTSYRRYCYRYYYYYYSLYSSRYYYYSAFVNCSSESIQICNAL